MSEPTNAREILARLVGFPSVSRDGNRALVDWVQGWLEGLGIACGRWDAPDGKNASLWAQVGPAVPGGLLLSGHTDVVPVEGQVWTGDPFVLAERDGRLYGRGTTDMKGFDALALAALVGARDLPLKRPLQVVLTHDEEVGCTGAPLVIPFVLADLPKAAAVIVGEPSGLACVTGHKGGIMFDVRVRGFAMHSSLMDRSVSAVMEAARLIGWANAENERLWAARPGPLAAAFDPPFTTLHSGTIRGGTAQNITAQDCRFDLGYRVVPGEDVGAHEARFLAEVARQSAAMAARRPEAGIEAPVAFRVPPLAPEAGGAAEALVRRVTGDNGVHVVSYGTEAGHYQAAGYSAVVCGPGDIAQAHQPDEFISVDDFQAGERFVGRLVETLLQ